MAMWFKKCSYNNETVEVRKPAFVQLIYSINIRIILDIIKFMLSNNILTKK
jgi:hypothetical protein